MRLIFRKCSEKLNENLVEKQYWNKLLGTLAVPNITPKSDEIKLRDKKITLPWGCLRQRCYTQHRIISSHLEIHIHKTQLLFTASQLRFTDHMRQAWDETKPPQQYSQPICSPLIFMHAGLQGMRSKPADSCISGCSKSSEMRLKDGRAEQEHQTLRVWSASLTGWSQEQGLRKRAGRTGWVKGEAGVSTFRNRIDGQNKVADETII